MKERTVISVLELESMISAKVSKSESELIIKDRQIQGEFHPRIFSSFSLGFHNCELNYILIHDNRNRDTLTLNFVECQINKIEASNSGNLRLLIFKTSVKELLISSSSGKFSLSKSRVDLLQINMIESAFDFSSHNSSIEIIEIESIFTEDSKCDIWSSDLKDLRFNGEINGSFHFKLIKSVESIRFLRTHSKKKEIPTIILDAIEVGQNPQLLSFTGMTLKGNLETRNSDFSKLKLHLENSDISEIKYFNTRFPDHLDPKVEDLFQAKEIYRQLKKVAEQNNDKIQARNYGASELEAYWKYLKSLKLSRWQTLPLWLSKNTNNFGRSWIKPFLLIFGTSAIFYVTIGLIQCYDGPSFLTFTLSGHFFSFLIPTHDLEYISNPYNIKFYPLIIFIDFLQRFVSGFLIYQLIRAFRFHYNN